ncbi:MAG TPA: 30S ribosome-binding factor RbfA [Dehalococcoidia bacterium]|jgi:ribosome-binding factor A|nr:30S ribosome-binding factor RbfA [Dehalococcoidia bacterium]
MSRRTERLNHLLRQEITDLLQREAKDPRLSVMVSVTRVSVSADMHFAKVFVSVLGTEEEKKGLLAGLHAASGFLRRELASRLSLRYTPDLSFVYDDTMEQAGKVIQLIDQVSSSETKTQGQGER